VKKIILPGEVPLPKVEFEQRYSVPIGGAPIPASCTVEWIREAPGESAKQEFLVKVWAAPPRFLKRAYRIRAVDDNLAAQEGLRTFEREYAAGLIS
jgi:hypothetical protein